MDDTFLAMLEHSLEAYFIFDGNSHEILYQNTYARDHFSVDESHSLDQMLKAIKTQSQKNTYARFSDVPLQSLKDGVLYCNIEAGYFDNQTKIWVRVSPISSEYMAKKSNAEIESDMIYLKMLPRLYKDVIFRLNPKTRRVTHAGDRGTQLGLPRVLDDFPECLINVQSIHPDDYHAYMKYAYGLLEGLVGSHTVRICLQNNEYEWFYIETVSFNDNLGKTLEILGKITNIQDRKNLETVASYDALSKTLNRSAFRSLVNQSLHKENSALFFIDIDNFKYINDNFGHMFGDKVIEEVGRRLNFSVRTSDYVGRVGGDEFVIFMKDIPDYNIIIRKTKQLLGFLAEPIHYDNDTHCISVSIGIARYPYDGANYEALYHCADLALYKSKYGGKNIATLYGKEEADYVTIQSDG